MYPGRCGGGTTWKLVVPPFASEAILLQTCQQCKHDKHWPETMIASCKNTTQKLELASFHRAQNQIERSAKSMRGGWRGDEQRPWGTPIYRTMTDTKAACSMWQSMPSQYYSSHENTWDARNMKAYTAKELCHKYSAEYACLFPSRHA
jgi:hypothetical protein